MVIQEKKYIWICIIVFFTTLLGCYPLYLSKGDKKSIEREMMINAHNKPVSPQSVGLPVYPNGEDYWEITSNVGHDEKSKPRRKMLHIFSYNVKDAPIKDVFDYYMKELKQKGWRIVSQYYKNDVEAKNTHWTIIAKKYIKDIKRYQLVRMEDGVFEKDKMNHLQLELYELQ